LTNKQASILGIGLFLRQLVLFYYNIMKNTIRKSIDIPEKDFKKLQLQAVLANVSLKFLIESIVIKQAQEKTNTRLDEFVQELTKTV
jgi:hypothetical protein